MPLTAGARLGPYEIVAPIGAGGMGEVYRARDTRLGRDVAIKVLPEHLSANPDLRARFEREARAVSSLNHPHICTLHDIGREGSTDYLVMELIEGESLSERLARGPMPTAEVLRVGIQIADALDRAHRAGIVHRDLKPGNVMLARSGAKLMDFGLARASMLAGTPGSSRSQSPTMTTPLTAEGSLVGTFQYMSPEQLEGKEADARADLWALGAVLYEMSTGAKAFAGKSQASLIASIMREEPRAVSSIQPLSPPALDRLIGACLAKDPEERIQTAHDVKLQLQWIAEGGSQAGVPAPVAAQRKRREGLMTVVAIVAGLAAVALAAVLFTRPTTPTPVLRFGVRSPANTVSHTWPRLSPDGSMLAFLATDSSGVQQIWIQPLNTLEAHRLEGTEGAGRPFWSPDSRFLAYLGNDKLTKVPIGGGPPAVVAEAPGAYDGSWGANDLIMFDGAGEDSLRCVPAGGGTVRGVGHMDRAHGERQQAWPYFFPDGKHYLYVSYSTNLVVGSGQIRVGTLGSQKTVVVGQTDGRAEYAPPGYILFMRGTALMGQRFSLSSLKTSGDPFAVAQNLVVGTSGGFFSTSPSGMLAVAAEPAGQVSRLQWFDRTGKLVGVEGAPGNYRDIALSPDGTRLAMSLFDPVKVSEDIWVRQLARGITTRLTFDPGDEINPVWSPDGQKIAYASDAKGLFEGYFRFANGVGAEDSITSSGSSQGGPTDWSRDGKTWLVRVRGAGAWDVAMVHTDAPGKLIPFITSPANDSWGRFSPDGRWVSYQSAISGRSEVYVQSANGSGGKWQISSSGGGQGQWRADGKEIFYQTPDRTIMSVPVNVSGDNFDAGTPVPLFRAYPVEEGYASARIIPTAAGTRFLVNTRMQDIRGAMFTITTNWTKELKGR